MDQSKMQVDNDYNEKVVSVLEFLLEKLEDKNFNWVLVGSTNLFIQGVSITAKDIDIVSTKDDILKIEEIFETYSLKKIVYSESEKYRSWFGRLIIDNIQVDLMAELEYKTPDSNWLKSTSLESKEIITFKEYKVPVNPFENELLFYKKMNRENDKLKVKLIEEFKDIK